jgi:tetratricopeptide (TPR) repeat protein
VPARQLQSILETVPLLLELGRPEGVLLTLKHAFEKAKTRADFLLVFHSSLRLTLTFRQQHLSFFLLLCYRAGNREVCLALLESAQPSQEINLYLAWSLADKTPQEALDLCKNVNPAEFSRELNSILLRTVARATAHLRDPDWQLVYQKTQLQLQGRELGLCHLEYGYFLTRMGEEIAARSEYAKALGLLEYDHHFAAHLNHSIGISCLRHDQLEKADHYLTCAVVLIKHPDAHAFRATAWLGLAMLRRAQGEYVVALEAFQTALHLASDPADQISALRGLGHCYRCMGQPDEALVYLEKTLETKGSPPTDELYADLAAAQLQLGNPQAAFNMLERVVNTREETDRRTMLEALLAIQAGKPPTQKLESLDAKRLWVREECQIFPELGRYFTFDPVPKFGIVVETDGAIRFRTHTHPIDFSSKHLGAALVVYLALHKHKADTERLLEALEIRGKTTRERKKTLNKAAHAFCAAVGWKQALVVKKEIYQLAPTLGWQQQLPNPSRADFFCEGRDDPFIAEWRLAHEIDKPKRK